MNNLLKLLDKTENLLRTLYKTTNKITNNVPGKSATIPKPKLETVKKAGIAFPKEKPCATNFSPLTAQTQGQGRPKGKRLTPKQSEIVKKARAARNKGLSEAEAEELVKKAREAGLPARGTETHPDHPHGKIPHIHVGPVNHIPIN